MSGPPRVAAFERPRAAGLRLARDVLRDFARLARAVLFVLALPLRDVVFALEPLARGPAFDALERVALLAAEPLARAPLFSLAVFLPPPDFALAAALPPCAADLFAEVLRFAPPERDDVPPPFP